VLDNFLQVTVNGLIDGSTYALLGVAFGLIIGVTGRFHVAFAMTYTLAAFVAAWLGMFLGAPFWVAVIAGALAAALVGAAIDRFVYWPILLRTGANGLLMVSSHRSASRSSAETRSRSQPYRTPRRS